MIKIYHELYDQMYISFITYLVILHNVEKMDRRE